MSLIVLLLESLLLRLLGWFSRLGSCTLLHILLLDLQLVLVSGILGHGGPLTRELSLHISTVGHAASLGPSLLRQLHHELVLVQGLSLIHI